jgi:two-component system sensor histidine kinase ChiS
MRFVVFLGLLLLSFCALASGPAARFERLSIEQGLSQSAVASIVQDRDGFLWVGTEDGLNRYDGYEFKIFQHSPKDPHSISDNHIKSIFEDSKGALWVGTLGGGLNKFDKASGQFKRFVFDENNPQSLSNNRVWTIFEDTQTQLWVGTEGGLNRFDGDHFSRFKHQPGVANSLSHNHIRSITQDRDGGIWVGTYGGGLNRFNAQQSVFFHYKNSPSDPNSLSNDKVMAIHEDTLGVLWVGTDGGGLNKFDSKTQTFFHYRHQPSNPLSLGSDNVWAILDDEEEGFWLATQGAGLNRFDSKLGQFSPLRHQSADPHSLSNDNLWTLFIDSSQNLWTGGNGGGLNKLDLKRSRFGHYKHQPWDERSLGPGAVFALFEDSKSTLWVGTDSGLNRFDANIKGFKHYNHQPDNPNSLSHDWVMSVVEDTKGVFWIGTMGGGLNRFDPVQNQFTHFKHDPSVPDSLGDDNVSVVYQDTKGTLWIGTWGGGLNQFLPQSGRFVVHKPDDTNRNSISHDSIMSIFEDSAGTLWVGTFDGLNRYDAKTGRFDEFQQQPNNANSLSHNFVTSIYESPKGILWLGTYGGGLNRFDLSSGLFSHYRTDDGLSDDSIYGIVEDDDGQLWLSTNQGLSRFDPKAVSFVNYDVNDGLQSNEFNGVSYHRSQTGELFFGGINGFNRFHVNDIQQNAPPPVLKFTDFLLFNQSVLISNETAQTEKNYHLPKAISELEQMFLTHHQSLVSFEFAALDFTSPGKNQYAYKLEGFDQNWINTGARNRRATYTNLPAGDYTLRVKASNWAGVWNNEGAAIKITVLSPPWKSWWAYSVYGLALVLLVYLLLWIHSARNKARDQSIVNDQLKEVNKLKDAFLANTSHELRTPLHGIIGLTESLIDGIAGQLPKTANKNLAMVVASGKRLANLINDILDLSKLNHANIALNTQPIDLYATTDVVLTLLKPLLGNKKLMLVNNVSTLLPMVQADEDRLLQIMHNLVGNAIKFTDFGNVTVDAEVADERLKVSITDTGIGIAKDQFDRIFASFEQVHRDTERSFGGTGLGLTISKQLVELHGGHLSVASQQGMGSTFSFTLALSDVVRDERNMPLVSAKTDLPTLAVVPPELEEIEDEALNAAAPLGPKVSRFRLLLVDDEPVNLQVLHNHLSLQNYQLVEVTDGLQALEALANNGPFDMVLLDVMMPKLSGYQVCEKIRETYSANDLPVIFLTAKNRLADMMQCFAVGANDYLSKPVSKPELLTRVKTHLKLLESNRDLAQSKQSIVALSEISAHISSVLDLNQLMNTVYERIKDLMDVDAFVLGLYEPDEQKINFHLNIEQGQYLPDFVLTMDEDYRPAVWCVAHQKPLIINDFERDYGDYFNDLPIPTPKAGGATQSVMYWPLIVGGRIIGVLSVQSYVKNAYDLHQQNIIKTLASTTAIALDHAKAYQAIEEQKQQVEQQKQAVEDKVAARTEQLQQSNQNMTTLSEICTDISSTLDYNKVLHKVYNGIKDLMDADIFMIGLFDEEQAHIEFELAIKSDEVIPPFVVSMTEKTRPAVRCFVSQLPVIFNDMSTEMPGHLTDMPIHQGNEHRVIESIMYWPLIVHGQIIGVLTVQSYRQNAYDEHSQHMIGTIASTTGIALDNAHAYREVEQKNNQIMATQQKLIQSENLASLGTLTAGIAHEINNPTNFVHVSAQNLEVDLTKCQQFIFSLADEQADGEILESFRMHFAPLYEHLATIKDGTDRINTIVKDLRGFTNIDTAEKAPVDIGDVLLSTINLAKTKYMELADFTMDFQVATKLNCYPAQLNQVFMNLIVNACDAIRDKQRQQQSTHRGHVQIGCYSRPGFIDITVKDDGSGMSEETRRKLFLPFYTTKTVGEGTGLGLSISYSIVQKHDGELTVESELGVGTEFKLSLPA